MTATATIDADRVQQAIEEHKRYFAAGTTQDVKFRIAQLLKLRDAIQKFEPQLTEALYRDLRKGDFEAYATEIGFALDSIRHTAKQLKRWTRPRRVKTPLVLMPSTSSIRSEPYGTVLIISPFNYPFQLCMEPLIGAIAAGNCALLKPSELTPNVSAVIARLIGETFDPAYIRVVEGEKEVTSLLINAPFDLIFFTGSTAVGKIVMAAAAKNLVPVILELGGKSPVIVDASANLDLAAKRIAWGKFMNTGQTCIAPDYILAHADIKEQLIAKLKETISGFYGTDAAASRDYGRIVNTRRFDQLAAILEQDRAGIRYGGTVDRDDLYIEPTLLDSACWKDAAMAEEIFGPILPIMEYQDLEEAINGINARPKPLALYVFTENRSVEREVLSRISFGGGCVNDTISHIINPYLPFGGIGNSGIGTYHGKHGFDQFSHQKSILKKSTLLDITILFPPYNDRLKWIKRLLK
ncbi:aldehyde dehydrogenase [Paenibacillus sp. NPDC058174]|uniref:aldehyde dehydrogenase n=1 Tax=Paenibacillus sp. NPDC058174 TaxID=3346366 RepID=UPI0036DE983D